MREQVRHYIDVSMNGAEPQYELIGDGVESLTEEMNPEEETKHYINMAKASSNVKSYQRSFEIDREDCKEDAMQTWIDGLVDTLPTGAAAKTSYIRLRLRDAVAAQTGEYRAIRVPCTVSVASSGGDGGDYVHNVVNVKQCGEDVPGTFNVTTNTFTED